MKRRKHVQAGQRFSQETRLAFSLCFQSLHSCDLNQVAQLHCRIGEAFFQSIDLVLRCGPTSPQRTCRFTTGGPPS
jgi:hypothetical protein